MPMCPFGWVLAILPTSTCKLHRGFANQATKYEVPVFGRVSCRAQSRRQDCFQRTKPCPGRMIGCPCSSRAFRKIGSCVQHARRHLRSNPQTKSYCRIVPILKCAACCSLSYVRFGELRCTVRSCIRFVYTNPEWNNGSVYQRVRQLR